jgi:hypothetical protein
MDLAKKPSHATVPLSLAWLITAASLEGGAVGWGRGGV